MRLNIVQNASRNIIFSVMKKIYGIVISFAMRTIMIYMMGVDYAGLNSIFTSLLNVLSLAELGIGSAIVFNMYKPIAEDDREKICGLLNVYKRCYRLIGLIILAIGLMCMPFLDHLVSGEIPGELNIRLLFLMHLVTTACSYSVFSYRQALFSAFQRTDIGSRVHMLTTTLKCLSQALALFWLRNYYAYLMIGLGTVLLENAIMHILAARLYPAYKAEGSLSDEETKTIVGHVKDLLLSKIGGVVVNSVDSIVISAVLGLSVLGLYQNYYFILNSVSGIVIILYRSCLAGLGNKLAHDGAGSAYESFENMSFALVWICGVCVSCFLGLFQPFISIWVGSEMLLDYGMVISFCAFFCVFQMMCLCSTYEDASGIWHYGRFRPLLEAALNLTLNLILVHRFGLYGILLSTIISMACFSYPWLLRNLFKYVYCRKMRAYVKQLSAWALCALIVGGATGSMCNYFMPASIPWLLLRGMVCVTVPLAAMFALYRKNDRLRWATQIARRVFKREKRV